MKFGVGIENPRIVRQFRAFTLIELLMVIAIMAIVLAMTVALGPSVIGSNAMSRGLSNVASSLSLARSEAVRMRKPTYFVLAPTNNLDERSYNHFAILQAGSAYGTDYTYITRWQKLPQGVLFATNASANTILATPNNLPYPSDGTGFMPLPCIKFAPEGGLDEDLHTAPPRVALQNGVRMTATNSPEFRGDYVTNEVVVQRFSGKVSIVRAGEK